MVYEKPLRSRSERQVQQYEKLHSEKREKRKLINNLVEQERKLQWMSELWGVSRKSWAYMEGLPKLSMEECWKIVAWIAVDSEGGGSRQEVLRVLSSCRMRCEI